MDMWYVAASPPGFFACEGGVSRVIYMSERWLLGWVGMADHSLCRLLFCTCWLMVARGDGGCEGWR
jgi:hypothetical protein